MACYSNVPPAMQQNTFARPQRMSCAVSPVQVAMIRSAGRKGAGGWTLTELLTVIAIMGVLMAVMIPLTMRAVDASRSAACIGNLRSIGGALHLYAADHNGDLVPAAQGPYGYWYNLLDDYMGGTDQGAGDAHRPNWQHCPAKKEPLDDPQIVGYGWNFAGFGNNTWGQEGTDGWQHTRTAFANLMMIENPEELVIVGDSKDAGVAPDKIWEHRYIYSSSGFWYNHARRHKGGGHYLYVDAHIEWMTPEMLQVKWIRKTGQVAKLKLKSRKGVQICQRNVARSAPSLRLA